MYFRTKLIFLEIFVLLHKLCPEHGFETTDFTHSRGEPTEEMFEVLNIIKSKLGWKRSKNLLLTRIRKVGKNTKFSVRETKLLRKLINQQLKDGLTDFSAVLHHFPGKT